MKALCYMGPKQLALRDVAVPELSPHDVLIKVRAVGICGSDVHGWLGITGRRIPPVIMGHEFSGVVARVGSAVTCFAPGDAVIPQPINACWECEYCRAGKNQLCSHRTLLGVMDIDGAMAEYVKVPEHLLYSKPDGFSFETAALTEPFAVAYTAVRKRDDWEGKTVMIIGSGTIGLCILKMLQPFKPAKIIVCDLSDVRLETALRLGADAVVNPRKEDYLAQVSRLTDGRMLDFTIEAVGVEATVNQSIRALRPGGVSVWVGVSQQEMTINMHDVVCKDRIIIGSMNYSHQDFGEALKILAAGEINCPEEIITDVVSLDKAADMFAELHDNPDGHLKALITFPG